MRRDITILIILLVLLYGVSQISGVNVTRGLENSFANQYTLHNQCAGEIVIVNNGDDGVRIAPGASETYNPLATAVMQLQFDDGETGWFPLKIEGSDLEVSGEQIPAESDIFGRNPTLIACP